MKALPDHLKERIKKQPELKDDILNFWRRNNLEEMEPSSKVPLEGLLTKEEPKAYEPPTVKEIVEEELEYNYPWFKEQENPNLKAGARHKSPEGGTDTVGFGHKLTPEEEIKEEVYGIPIDEIDKQSAKEILKIDLQKAEQKAKRRFESWPQAMGVEWEDLRPEQKHLFLDYEYNLGSWKKFPSFFSAVISNNKDKMLKEYKRYFRDSKGKLKELGKRNKATRKFIKENF